MVFQSRQAVIKAAYLNRDWAISDQKPRPPPFPPPHWDPKTKSTKLENMMDDDGDCSTDDDGDDSPSAKVCTPPIADGNEADWIMEWETA